MLRNSSSVQMDSFVSCRFSLILLPNAQDKAMRQANQSGDLDNISVISFLRRMSVRLVVIFGMA